MMGKAYKMFGCYRGNFYRMIMITHRMIMVTKANEWIVIGDR